LALSEPTDKQLAYIRSLCEQRDVTYENMVERFGTRGALSGNDAAHAINWLMDQPTVRSVQQTQSGELDPGVYQLPTGEIYVLKWNRERTRTYAKKLTESTERVTEGGEHVKFDFVYEAGAKYKLKEEHLMPLERAKPLMIKYSRCIACGRHLKRAKSVEAGIGPVCVNMFGGLAAK